MKKIYLSSIILAAVALGCTKSSVVDSSTSYQEVIEFESYAGRIPVSKASNTTIDVLKEEGFQAIAYNSGDYIETYLNETVTFNGTKWTYGDKKIYWPEGSNLDFVAYGRNVTDLISDLDEASFIYTVPSNAAEQKDLVVATPWLNHNNRTEAGSTVKFDFKHLLTKIGFSIVTNNDYTGTNPNPVDVTIKNIRIRATLYNKGAVHLLASTPKVVPDPNSSVSSYSLFNHNYPAKMQDEYDEEGKLSGFVCHNSTQVVPIYPNMKFKPEDYEEVQVPTSTDQSVVDNRFMMILPTQSIGEVMDVDDIDHDAITDENVPPYIEVVYQLSGGREETVRAFLKDYGIESFLQGRWYEFTFNVSTTAIKFDVKINNGWDVIEDPLKDEQGDDQA